MYYCYCALIGKCTSGALTAEEITAMFGEMTGSAPTLIVWIIVAILLSFGICSLGMKKV